MNKQYLILLDGPKGAGKTTLGKILERNLKCIFLSLDLEKNLISNNEARTRDQLFAEAFEILLRKSEKLITQGNNLVIDCGITEKRIIGFEKLSKKVGIELKRYFLKASYNILIDRVRLRDQLKGKTTDEKRFKEVYNLIRSKDLGKFHIIDISSTFCKV